MPSWESGVVIFWREVLWVCGGVGIHEELKDCEGEEEGKGKDGGGCG